MTYRTVLLHVTDDPGVEQRIAVATALAERFGARLVGMHVSPPPIIPVGYGEGAAYVGPEIIEAQREAAKIVAERVEKAFRTVTADRADTAWRMDDGDPGELVAMAARTADLTISGRLEASGIDALARQVVEQLVHEAGGPVLMLPPGAAKPPGTRVLVAWNGRREAARALKDALPFIVTAEETYIVSIGEDAGEELEAAVAMVERHGAKVRAHRVTDYSDAGHALLEATVANGCDLLVMGAYGHSRLREMVLGGATRHILQNAKVAVLFSC